MIHEWWQKHLGGLSVTATGNLIFLELSWRSVTTATGLLAVPYSPPMAEWVGLQRVTSTVLKYSNLKGSQWTAPSLTAGIREISTHHEDLCLQWAVSQGAAAIHLVLSRLCACQNWGALWLCTASVMTHSNFQRVSSNLHCHPIQNLSQSLWPPQCGSVY